MEVTMKPILPLCICTLALSGCFTVNVSDEATTGQTEQTEQTEQTNTENQNPENSNDDNKKVTLNWQPPTEDVDGNDVDGISAYKIFYGNIQGNPDKHITVHDGNVKEFTISNLEPGEYYFTMSAVSNGMESDASNEHYFKIEELN